MLLVYSARHPRARSARGGGRNKPQHTDAPCYNWFIANYDVKFPVTVVTVTSALAFECQKNGERSGRVSCLVRFTPAV